MHQHGHRTARLRCDQSIEHGDPSRKQSPSGWHPSFAVGWPEGDELMTTALGLTRRRLPRQRDREGGPSPRAAHHVDPPAVRLGNPFGDGESQPRAGTLTGTRARRIGAPEAIEDVRSEEHTSELQSRLHLVCRLLLEKKKKQIHKTTNIKNYITEHPH